MGLPSMGLEMYEGTSLPMNMYFGASKSQWTTGMVIDLIQIGDFMAMVMALSGQ
jgi:hypothetical protein